MRIKQRLIDICSVHRSSLLALCLIAGCSDGDKIQTVPVKGTVVHRGGPVEGAQVTFMPASGPVATGTTDARGEFRLSTLAFDGAVVGTYKVLISKTVLASDKPYAAARHLLPAQYATLQASKLEANVTADHTANHFEFVLSDK